MLRRTLLAATLVVSFTPLSATATEVEVCVRAVTLTFSPPLGLNGLVGGSGTVTRHTYNVCPRADSSGNARVVGFEGVSSGTYVGDCLHAEVAGEFRMTLVGSAGALYAVYPHYAVVDPFVLVPDQVCNVSSASGLEAGPGIWP